MFFYWLANKIDIDIKNSSSMTCNSVLYLLFLYYSYCFILFVLFVLFVLETFCCEYSVWSHNESFEDNHICYSKYSSTTIL